MAQGLTNLIQKDTGDGTILIYPWNYSSITQGTWVFSISTSYPYNGYFYNSSNALNDQINYKVWLSKGAYNLTIEALHWTTAGACNVLLDSSVVGYVNFYAANTTQRRTGLFSGILVETTGLKTLSLKAVPNDGGNYYLSLHALLLQRAI